MNDFSFSQRAQYTNFSLHENSSALKDRKSFRTKDFWVQKKDKKTKHKDKEDKKKEV